MTELRVGGLSPLSSCDWPGELAATIFCQGCPWDCRYCHNQSLRPACGPQRIPWAEIVDFLARRRALLDGVVFSGGEPTLQAALPQAIREVRAMGFKIGLHTAGPYPERLKAVLPLVDWVGFDIKAPFPDYARITKAAGSGEKASESLRHLLQSGVAYQVRTTVHPSLLDEAALAWLKEDLAGRGVRGHVLQKFRREGCVDPELVAGAGLGMTHISA
ncbi:anaerobic ribonucleoside-triphosphate reductase activating protein [Afifella pfennigii]|uniref:anaerobic ribonucleoside-triphosphate reductase activating protein n=1 Tax=Afifella pfennigii TaxID=209897 RepID=UPI00068C4E2B|nr:anaerobic ribonucleoside-triphosphate reductase activating protein [Afifella pfennigii]